MRTRENPGIHAVPIMFAHKLVENDSPTFGRNTQS